MSEPSGNKGKAQVTNWRGLKGEAQRINKPISMNPTRTRSTNQVSHGDGIVINIFGFGRASNETISMNI